MNNKQIWEGVSKPPVDALKQIQAGRLKGMSDINPQWRLEIMTETFGPVGIGWGYTIDKLWNEPGANGEILAFAEVSVWYKHNDVKSEPVQGTGGSKHVANEKNGLYSSDEGYKMAVTDALSVAFKALGVGAEIYRGRWDGSKYKDAKEIADRDGKPESGGGDDGNKGSGTDKTLSSIQSAKDVKVLKDIFDKLSAEEKKKYNNDIKMRRLELTNEDA